MNKTQLRRLIRQQRRSLSAQHRRYAANRFANHTSRAPELIARKHIAVYWQNDGEIDPALAIEQWLAQKKVVYLPVLHPFKAGHLLFVRYQPGMVMRHNRYGIAEPDWRYAARLPARFMSAILVPLVAFDPRGARLGMGGGYYDRSLAPCRDSGRRPLLVGCAYEFQKLERLPMESWDIPMHMIVTEDQCYRF
ncbi:5-formyltetrahydrofolate cyclo-ligase [Bacterioplanes sanyensis]|uniref:5-formyltetrahydrofolate cyclo-ligase n=1 Tax=Bacterioplanes sanyensis TaxID=1249553 RepID=A0A222FH01_9GAMM|nr:5-formyltetrahydrofolate cyclo-ligase [Bacterioplanes sanyensis]ASP37764.1 5-formyltetrahydrofolate cyclo-ligase [Bacterioplanes sanyensis]